MASGPPKTFEALVAVVIPPACREEVLGDLHERYRSTRRYGLDVASTVPLVILSRIQRTADSQAGAVGTADMPRGSGPWRCRK